MTPGHARFPARLPALLVLLALAATPVLVPATAQAQSGPQAEPTDSYQSEQLARYCLNYAAYLTDRGDYAEALEYYQTALESSALEPTRMQALTAQAMLLAAYLDAPEAALPLYQYLGEHFPSARDMALFRQGLLLWELGRGDEAAELLRGYLGTTPDGSFSFQAEALLGRIEGHGPPPDAQTMTARPTLRVLLSKSSGQAVLRGGDGGGGGLICTNQGLCAQSFTAEASGGRILLDGRETGLRALTLSADGSVSATAGGRTKKVRGGLKLVVEDDRLLVINLVDIEDYLLGVVPSESYASWPQETLKAQAVAARTYALYQAAHRRNLAFDLYDDTKDQAYKGLGREHPDTTRAVLDTAGVIAVSSVNNSQRPILAMYTANSGGYCADAAAMFNHLGKPYLTAHPDPASLDATAKHGSWTVTMPLAEIESRLASMGIDAPGLTDISVAETGPSGRALKVQLHYAGGITAPMRTWTTLRKALNLKDILFTVTRSGQNLVFEGHGWGHGVGYSQWGGAVLGRTLDYQQILNFYYPGATLVRQW